MDERLFPVYLPVPPYTSLHLAISPSAGESQLEMDKRLFRNQLQSIKAQMEEIATQRQISREKRRDRDDLPKVAIVGYTNAGKSTLLNQLCSSDEVYADDLLFATLDPTTRRVALPGGKEVLVADTLEPEPEPEPYP